MSTMASLFGPPGLEIIDAQVFTSSGPWAKPPGTLPTDVVVVDLWGGGASGMMHGTDGSAYGGAGGGHYRACFLASALSPTETVVVGAGGEPVSVAGSGKSGGVSSFKTAQAAGGTSDTYGGHGGGVFSPTQTGGGPAGGGSIGTGHTNPGKWGGGGTSSAGPPGPSGADHGGAAGFKTQKAARCSIWGGAAGGSHSANAAAGTTDGGQSLYGGNGGDGATGSGATTAGSVPGGGGGGSKVGPSGAGARGEVRVYVLRGVTQDIGEMVLS